MSKESKCFAFGSVSGCREQCHVLIDGDCELYTSAEYYNAEMELAALRAELTEKEAELAKLKRQREQTEFDFRNLDKMHSVIIERHNGLLKENAELRERLKPVEEVYKVLELSSEWQLIQAIKAACEKKEKMDEI